MTEHRRWLVRRRTTTFRASPRNIVNVPSWNAGCDGTCGIGAKGVEGPRISSGGQRKRTRTLEVTEDGVEREAGGARRPNLRPRILRADMAPRRSRPTAWVLYAEPVIGILGIAVLGMPFWMMATRSWSVCARLNCPRLRSTPGT